MKIIRVFLFSLFFFFIGVCVWAGGGGGGRQTCGVCGASQGRQTFKIKSTKNVRNQLQIGQKPEML